MPFAFAGGLVLVLGMLLVGVLVVTIFNTVVALQRRVDRALANVEVALKQRHDELPNLVDAVRGQLAFERTVLDEVTRLRATWTPDGTLSDQARTADQTTAAVRSLFATVERYPQLHSQENVLALQSEIERLETLIARRRELFNQQVYLYNATIQQLPAVLLAGVFGWQPRELFEASPVERTTPEVGQASLV
jgi:LemA protein